MQRCAGFAIRDVQALPKIVKSDEEKEEEEGDDEDEQAVDNDKDNDKDVKIIFLRKVCLCKDVQL